MPGGGPAVELGFSYVGPLGPAELGSSSERAKEFEQEEEQEQGAAAAAAAAASSRCTTSSSRRTACTSNYCKSSEPNKGGDLNEATDEELMELGMKKLEVRG